MTREYPLTERQKELLATLEHFHGYGREWCTPQDLGGKDGSDHSTVLRQLVNRKLVERRKRPGTFANELGHGRGSYEYRKIQL